MLSVLRRFTDSDYPFGIFKLFFLLTHIYFDVLRSPPWPGSPLGIICVTIDDVFIPIVVITVSSYLHSCLNTGSLTKSNTTDAVSGTETAYHSRAPPVLNGARGTRSVVFGWILSIIDCGFGSFICLAFE
jgi:hypothetical protein